MKQMPDWDAYEPARPRHKQAWGTMEKADAKDQFEWFLAERKNRIEQLRRLVATDGIVLGDSNRDFVELDSWFTGIIQPSEQNPRRIDNLTAAVAADLGIFIGETCIKRYPWLYWKLVPQRKHIDFQWPSLMGFHDYAGHNINCMRLMVGTATRVLRGLEVECQMLGEMAPYVDSIEAEFVGKDEPRGQVG